MAGVRDEAGYVGVHIHTKGEGGVGRSDEEVIGSY